MIAYLRRRKQRGSMIPMGAVNSRKTTKPRRRSFSQAVDPGEEQEVAEYFAHVYADYPNVFTPDDMAAMTGLNKKSFQRIMNDGHMKFLEIDRRYIIPKTYFWEFIASRRFIDAWSNSEDFIRILEGFEEWRS